MIAKWLKAGLFFVFFLVRVGDGDAIFFHSPSASGRRCHPDTKAGKGFVDGECCPPLVQDASHYQDSYICSRGSL